MAFNWREFFNLPGEYEAEIKVWFDENYSNTRKAWRWEAKVTDKPDNDGRYFRATESGAMSTKRDAENAAQSAVKRCKQAIKARRTGGHS